ncbi:PVC-type heme-binding CxxCH protein [Lignipirellula cremea]|uniref:Cytochrome c domain-containing protein n=1 Tax=Lignipirellula cremea TaxID=2528010 RepID=A0A518E2H1_9BACT|nr:PVC-type heme-binding CxxCH protein [Lignipirellula cremea]QDU98263.1 hypothetical protein Pla8534_61240 [Lignipirellula cremea]
MRFCIVLAVLAVALPCRVLRAEEDDFQQNEFPARPTPAWVTMIDQGSRDPRLAGLQTPAGIKVEIVAEAPVVVDPVGMTFAADGQPYVLEWNAADSSKHSTYEVTFADGSTATVNRMTKATPDELKLLRDTSGDGRYDTAQVVMDDLEIPSSVLVRDGWAYLPSVGHVIRRKQSQPGGKYDVQEEIVRGLCGFHHHQASGVTVTHDGWMMITSGDDDNRAEGSDGSRATVLRTGAIFRCRPDGSHVSEFARGFRNPYRNVVQDDLFNIFHVDNDQEDGSKFQGVRLMHVQEGDDFGWRLKQGAVCCRTDFERGAVFGELPGKSPSMLKTGRGSPAGLLIYQGDAFPDFFRGVLIYPDVYRKLVRAYQIERRGATFAVVGQFTLMTSDDGLFRPCQAIQGPDGAIYIVDWRTDSGGAGKLWGDGEHGRIYRLSWDGIPGTPAIPPGPLDAWSKIATMTDAALWQGLEATDFEFRVRVLDELARRQTSSDGFLSLMQERSRPLPARAAALGGACRFYDGAVETALLKLLESDDSPELRRLAADGLSRHAEPEAANRLLPALLQRAADRTQPAVARAAALAAGNLAGQTPPGDPLRQQAAKQLAEDLTATGDEEASLRNGYLRAVERIEPEGVEALAGLLERQDRRADGVWAFTGLRTRTAATKLDQLLDGDRIDAFAEPDQIALLSAYRHYLVEPPIHAGAVAEWLDRHPTAPLAVQIAGLETIGLVGEERAGQTADVALRLLKTPDEQARLRVVQAIGDAGLVTAARPLAAMLLETDRSVAERRALVAALAKLRSRPFPFAGNSPPGVELAIDELATAAGDARSGEVRADVLTLLAQLDYAKAKPIAVELMQADDVALAAAAINVLAANKEDALLAGEAFLAGKTSRGLLSTTADALRRHAGEHPAAAEMLKKVIRGGLLVSLEPAEVARVEQLVQTTGDPERGRAVFADEKRGVCTKCHRLEGVGGQVGPDLTKVWETHTAAKLIESLVDPSKEIKEGFGAWKAITNDGKIYAGLKISETEQEVVLRDANGRDIRLPADQVDELIADKISLMPEGVIAQLSFQEFIDLVAFLKNKQAQQVFGAAGKVDGAAGKVDDDSSR